MGLQPLAPQAKPAPPPPAVDSAKLADDFLSSMDPAVLSGGCGGEGGGGGGGEAAPSMGLAPLGSGGGGPGARGGRPDAAPTFTEAELLDYAEDAPAAAVDEPPKKRLKEKPQEAAPKAATTAAAPASDATGASPTLDSVLADALGLTGSKRAAPEPDGAAAAAAEGVNGAAAAKAAKSEEQIAWLIEGRVSGAAGHRGARVQEALRAAAVGAGLADVSITDVADT